MLESLAALGDPPINVMFDVTVAGVQLAWRWVHEQLGGGGVRTMERLGDYRSVNSGAQG